MVVGWNDMPGVILGVDHGDSWQTRSLTGIGELIEEHEGVQGIQFSTDEHGNVQAACIRGMKLVSMGDGLENVSSKI